MDRPITPEEALNLLGKGLNLEPSKAVETDALRKARAHWALVSGLPENEVAAFIDSFGLSIHDRETLRDKYLTVRDPAGVPTVSLREGLRAATLRELSDAGTLRTTRIALGPQIQSMSPSMREQSGRTVKALIDSSFASEDLLVAIRLGLGADFASASLQVGSSQAEIFRRIERVGGLSQVLECIIHLLPRNKALDSAAAAYLIALESEHNYYKLQMTLDSYIFDEMPSVAFQTVDQLVCSGKVVQWFDGALHTLPPIKVVQWWLDYRSIQQEYARLVGGSFAGRRPEIALVMRYLGLTVGITASSLLDSLKAKARTFFPSSGIRRVAPLVIYGPAGIGKTSIVAKTIKAEMLIKSDESLLFAVIDFERPSILVREPATVLAEMLRQVTPQIARSRELDDLRSALMEELLSTSVGQRTSRQGRLATPDVALLPAAIRQYVERFAELIGSNLHGRLLKVVVVFDSYELVGIHSQAFEEALWAFMDCLKREVPGLRTIVISRIDCLPKAWKRISITELDQSSVYAYYEGEGLDEEDAVYAYNAFGGMPLMMRVFAKLMDQSRKPRRRLLQEIKSGVIDRSAGTETVVASLYARLLSRIEDPRVRKLAWPGFVLRWLDASVVLGVLDIPCKLRLTSLRQAKSLIRELAREVTLVTEASDRLRPRSDVRRMMLSRLRMGLDEIRLIHESAVKYFRARGAEGDRAEELYHLLCLGDRFEELDKRWTDDAGTYLTDAVFEVNDHAKMFLAGRLRLDLPELNWREARVEDWERYALRSANDYLATGKGKAAVRIVTFRHDRTDESPLFFVEVEARLSCNQESEVRDICRRGHSKLSRHAGSFLWRQITLLHAYMLLVNGEVNECQHVLGELLSVQQESVPLNMQLVESYIRLRASRSYAGSDGDSDTRRREGRRAVGVIRKLSGSKIDDLILLAREIACEIGEFDPRYFEDFIRAHGIGILSEHQASLLRGLAKSGNPAFLSVELLVTGIAEEGKAFLPTGISQESPLKSKRAWRRIAVSMRGSLTLLDIVYSLRNSI